MKVFAIDPGITTGYAQGSINDGLMIVVTGEAKMSHNDLLKFLQQFQPDVVVTESFEFRQKSRKGLVLYSLELIGVAAVYCEVKNVPLMRQSAAKGKSYFRDAQLKKDGTFKPGRPHANDAARHLLHWFVFGSGYQYNTKGYRAGQY